jgi:hypothetical protein
VFGILCCGCATGVVSDAGKGGRGARPVVVNLDFLPEDYVGLRLPGGTLKQFEVLKEWNTVIEKCDTAEEQFSRGRDWQISYEIIVPAKLAVIYYFPTSEEWCARTMLDIGWVSEEWHHAILANYRSSGNREVQEVVGVARAHLGDWENWMKELERQRAEQHRRRKERRRKIEMPWYRYGPGH